MFKQVTTDNYEAELGKENEAILICYKKLCPHCKNMEKVLEKFLAQRPQIKLFSIDFEEEPNAMTALKAERPPTIFVVKNGKIVANKTGLMNPKEMAAFYDAAK